MNDQQRIETAADNCEVLRARLARYEDADGNPLGRAGVTECACGDQYPANSYGAGFMAANGGVCENCDASAPGHGEQVRVLGHDGWRQAVDNVSAYAHLYNSGFGIIHEIRAEYARLLAAAAPSAGSQKEQGE